MKLRIYLPLVIIALLSCSSRRSKALLSVGAQKVEILEAGKSLKVYGFDYSGQKIELFDFGSSHLKGWRVVRIHPSRLRIHTNDVGAFDIYEESNGCIVVPEGTRLSAGKTSAVKFLAEGGGVVVSAGATSVPYTDMFIHEELNIFGEKIDELNVRWHGETEAEITNASGKVLCKIRAR